MKKAFYLALTLLISLTSCKHSSKDGSNSQSLDSTASSLKQEASTTPDNAQASTSEPSYSNTLTYDDLTFEIRQEGHTVSIKPSGLKKDNTELIEKTDCYIKSSEIGDIDGDNSPEVFLYMANSRNEEITLIGYSCNARKSMSQVYLPPLTEKDQANQGYMGEDEYGFGENAFIRRFPVYKIENGSKQTTNKVRQIQYRLQMGEACKILTPYKTFEYDKL